MNSLAVEHTRRFMESSSSAVSTLNEAPSPLHFRQMLEFALTSTLPTRALTVDTQIETACAIPAGSLVAFLCPGGLTAGLSPCETIAHEKKATQPWLTHTITC